MPANSPVAKYTRARRREDRITHTNLSAKERQSKQIVLYICVSCIIHPLSARSSRFASYRSEIFPFLMYSQPKKLSRRGGGTARNPNDLERFSCGVNSLALSFSAPEVVGQGVSIGKDSRTIERARGINFFISMPALLFV